VALYAAEQPFYGLWMRDELAEHGYEISVGTLYPLLHQLEQDGYLISDLRVTDARRRRYYHATDDGRKLLAEIRLKLTELVNEALPQQATKPARPR
jgi:PadR family transcriptional regulator, regulatory protein PadR